MNFKNLIFATLTFGVMLSVSTKNNIAVSKPSKNLKSNYQKPLQAEQNFTYSKAIEHRLDGGRITTQFFAKNSKGYKIELSTLASKLGYDHFNWVSYVEVDPHGVSDRDGNIMVAPYNDPPMGGYQYDSADRLPFYWDVVNCDRCQQRNHIQNRRNLQKFQLAFTDAPTDSRLQPGESIEFVTSLVGVKSIDSNQQDAKWDVLHTFRWKTAKTAADDFEVSLVDNDVDTTQLPYSLMANMILDGLELSTPVKVSTKIDKR